MQDCIDPGLQCEVGTWSHNMFLPGARLGTGGGSHSGTGDTQGGKLRNAFSGFLAPGSWLLAPGSWLLAPGSKPEMSGEKLGRLQGLWKSCGHPVRPLSQGLNVWVQLSHSQSYGNILFKLIFKALALWADAFYKSIYPYVCLCVCLSVCTFTFEVPFKRLFPPTSQGWMSKIMRNSESLGKSNIKKWSQI